MQKQVILEFGSSTACFFSSLKSLIPDKSELTTIQGNALSDIYTRAPSVFNLWNLSWNVSQADRGNLRLWHDCRSSPISKQQLGLPSIPKLNTHFFKITREGALVKIKSEYFRKVIENINIATCQDHHLFTQCLKFVPKLYPMHKIQNIFFRFAYLSP